MNSQVKVLIAEYTSGIADSIAENLEKQGYTIAGVVNSPEQALESAILTSPDIVLMDLRLPEELDGFTVGWKILSELHCPIVYMTAPKEDCPDQSEWLNPLGFLVKPFTANELSSAIEQTLQQHRTRQTPVKKMDAVSQHLDEQFLLLLNAASAIAPMPRIYFEQGDLRVYTSTLEDARTLSDHCKYVLHFYRYHIYAWRWETERYQLYAVG